MSAPPQPDRVALVNPPFADPRMSPLALMLLQSRLQRHFGPRIDVTLHPVNIAFVTFLGGIEAYDHALSDRGRIRGFGDWFFRAAAFPDAADNTTAYLDRFYPPGDPDAAAVRRLCAERRPALNAFLDAYIERHGLHRARWVGFGAMFAQTPAALAMARRLKARNPGIVTILGGPACEGIMGQALADIADPIDAVFSGPALRALPAFCEALFQGRIEAAYAVPGVLSRRRVKTGRERFGEAVPPDQWPDVDYHAFLDAFERAFGAQSLQPVLLFETSRGCDWGQRRPCAFCGLNGAQRRYRALDAERAVARLNALMALSDRCAWIQAVDNHMPPDYPRTVFPRLKPLPATRLQYEVRADLDPASLRAFHQAGGRVLQPGIEALSDDALQRMGKGVSVFDNLRFLKRCSRLPLTLSWNLLIGMPGEHRRELEKYRRDFPLLMHLPPPEGAFPVEFVRFSRYFNLAKRYGLDLHPRETMDWIYPCPRHLLRRLATHFVDRNQDPARLDDWLDRLNSDITRWRARWFNTDGRHAAQLHRSPHQPETICDSRFGDPVVYRLRPDEARLLDLLEQPMTRAEAVRRLAPIAPRAVRQAFEALDARHFLFESSGRFLTLATRDTPAPP